MNFNVFNFLSSEEKIFAARSEIYHSKGPGFFIIRNFVPQGQVRQLREFWLAHEEIKGLFVKRSKKNKRSFLGGPNTYAQGEFNFWYNNFLWNKPAHELSHTLALQVQLLRNVLTSRHLYTSIFPLKTSDNEEPWNYSIAEKPLGYSLNYRVAIVTQGQQIIKPHHDSLFPPSFEPARLQATHFLSQHGVDYIGEGFHFVKNTGEEICFGRDVALTPGDLVIWRYNNLHGVRNVSTPDQGVGFFRVIYPTDPIYQKAKSSKLWQKKLGLGKIRAIFNKFPSLELRQ